MRIEPTPELAALAAAGDQSKEAHKRLHMQAMYLADYVVSHLDQMRAAGVETPPGFLRLVAEYHQADDAARAASALLDHALRTALTEYVPGLPTDPAEPGQEPL